MTERRVLPYERHDPLNALWVICDAHRKANAEIYKSALQRLHSGQPLNQIVEYCRLSYRNANAKYDATNQLLNGVK